MRKDDLLRYLEQASDADAKRIARALGVDYSVASMALLRLVRQGLASRRLDIAAGVYRYRLSDRGLARLAYLRSRRPGAKREPEAGRA